ncbi:hypothetical protein [Streptomyces sp. OR43]|uniref:hypothetical protein n=1 Tax=Streptomyces sp. or43 TaxID=2478957 RepID=UPI0011CD92FC|nr:hypothetical protein [Streptomyces sp. or43]TXS35729.1 hypothetical protein EAO72_19110 [Streptomyces sp. or43]
MPQAKDSKGAKTPTRRVLATITADDVAEQRAALCAWAKDNGLAPEDVAASPGLTVEKRGRRTVIVYAEFQRDDQGRIMTDPADPSSAWTIPRTAPLVGPLASYEGLDGLADRHDQ